MTERERKPIFLHVIDHPDGEWRNELANLDRVPSVGEHVAIGGLYFEVRLVVHCALETAHFSAEVYGVPVNHLQAVTGVRNSSQGEAS